MLKIKDLNVSVNEQSILKGIDLQIQAKEIVCITGESGAGKSTLLHLLGNIQSSGFDYQRYLFLDLDPATPLHYL